MAKKNMRYYTTQAIRSKGAHYNFVIGERSNGKTTAALCDILSDYYLNGRKGAIFRQMEEDIKGHKGASLFAGVVAAGLLEEITNGEFHNIVFRNRGYHLVKLTDEGEEIVQKEPFAHIFAISQGVHYKSNSYPNVGTIVFDEFMRADHAYLIDEVVQFLNLVSTIVRDKDDAVIFLIANTVSWNSPYFKKFGLHDVSKMKPGELAEFTYKKKRPTGEDIAMKVAVEYCEDTASYGGKPSDVYFLIDDERVNMITDGSFAIPNYPQCPHAFSRENVKCTYWIDTGETRVETASGAEMRTRVITRARLMKVGRDLFVFVDTVDESRYEFLRDERRDLFYDLEFSAKLNHFIDPAMPYSDRRTHFLVDAIRAGRMFFESNDAGENLMYYIAEAGKRSITAL